MKTVNEQIEEKQRIDAIGEKIMGMPRTERWKNIKALLFKIHPDFVEPDRLHCEAVAELRNFIQHDEFGSSRKNNNVGNGGMRHLFKIPTYIWHALRTDREFERLQLSSDKSDIKTLHKALWDAFPEYRAARRY
jgi:hypothetical protein